MGSGSTSSTFGKGKSTSRQRTRIPDYLRPLIRQGSDTSAGALADLRNMLGDATADDLVAGFSDPQKLAQELGIERALGGGGFFPTAQDTLLSAAGGQSIEDFLPAASFENLTSTASGRNIEDFLDPGSLGTLRSYMDGSAATPGMEALSQTASGDFLYGGEGFDQAVDAAVRAARPHILSTFGRAGAGGATGGLSQAAIGQSAVDAFANQYQQERQNQLNASTRLEDLRSGSARDVLGLSDAERDRSMSSAGLLADLGLAERGNQLNAATLLPDIGTADVDLLNQIGATQQDLEQLRLMAPIDAQMMLLQSALSGLPVESLLGKKTNNRYWDFEKTIAAQGGF